MAFANGGQIVTNGLVLVLDAADRNSYPGSGTVWSDMSGNGNTGTLTNGPTFSNANGGSIVFDGVDDSVTINNTISLSSDFSIEIWYNLTSTTAVYRIIFASNNFSVRFGDGGFQNRFQFGVNMSTVPGCYNVDLNKTGALNTWKHSLWTRESGVNKMYVDTIQQNLARGTDMTYTSSSFTDATSVTLTGGSTYLSVAAFPFAGRIPLLKIYNRALSASEILQNYNATKTRFGL